MSAHVSLNIGFTGVAYPFQSSFQKILSVDTARYIRTPLLNIGILVVTKFLSRKRHEWSGVHGIEQFLIPEWDSGNVNGFKPIFYFAFLSFAFVNEQFRLPNLALKFPTFWFDTTPQGKFMLNIAFGQSKYYIDNLSENVKRGLRQKVRRGEYPGVAPTGYLNDKAVHRMVVDPERFRLVRTLFELYATGDYTLKDLRDEVTRLGLTSRKGKVLTISNMQMILVNPFYYGAFKFNGELYEGKHTPTVAKKLFDRCAAVMAEKSRPKKRGEKVYPLRGLFLCGECKCAITAETQKGHAYYRCTKKKGVCSQLYIREELLASQISDYLQKVSLPEDWTVEMLAQLDKDQTQTAQSDALHTQTLKDEISTCEAKLDVLLDAHRQWRGAPPRRTKSLRGKRRGAEIKGF